MKALFFALLFSCFSAKAMLGDIDLLITSKTKAKPMRFLGPLELDKFTLFNAGDLSFLIKITEITRHDFTAQMILLDHKKILCQPTVKGFWEQNTQVTVSGTDRKGHTKNVTIKLTITS